MIEIFAGSGEDTSLSTLFLDEHVVEAIALQEIDIGIDGSIAPVEEQLWSGMLADVLNQQKIPFVQKNVFGAGMAMKIGLMNERIRFYVFYGHLAEAKKLVDELFSPLSEENDNEN